MILKHIGPTDKHVKSAPPPSYKSCKTIYKIQRGGGTYFFSCENFIAHPFLWVLWEMFHRKKIVKRWILKRFVVYFNIILP